MENDIDALGDAIELYFTVTKDMTGQEIELKPGGEQIRVTNANKEEFKKLKCHYIAYLQHKT